MGRWRGKVDKARMNRASFGATGRKRRTACAQSFVVLVALVLVCMAGLTGVVRAAAELCPNAASRQGPSVSLPECRVYEQVTPVNKGAAIDLFPSEGLSPIKTDRGYVAEDGNEFLLNATSSIGADAPTTQASYVFSRGTQGWATKVVVPSSDQVQQVIAEVFDPINLSTIGFSDQSGSAANLYAGSESAYQRKHLVGPPAGPYTTLSALSGFAAISVSEASVHLVGGSADLSDVVLESENHTLAPEATGQDSGSEALYEADGGGECNSETSNCKLINVNNEGKLISPCGATLGQGDPEDHSIAEFGGTHGAVSSDGSKVFFTAPDPGMVGVNEPGCWNLSTAHENPPELYMRLGGTTTVDISAPEEGVEVGTLENPILPAVFVGASADGSKAFFMTETELTEDDKTHAPELYEYETETGRLTRISHGESGTAEGNVDFVGAVSSDGSNVYFAAFGKLASGASALTPQPANKFAPVNLYRYDTFTGTTTYITTLNSADYPLSITGEYEGWSGQAVFGGRPAGRAESVGLRFDAEWYTTNDGQYLVFGTDRPITGYDNTAAPGVRCQTEYPGIVIPTCGELYRYDAGTNSIVCVSCAGSAPVDNALFARAAFEKPASLPPRPVSEDGDDVFFDSASALVPQAVPGRVHVYEWHEGTISMISSSADPGQAFFLGSSADGSNVFFSTHAQLSPQDTDASDDIYDARVDGGFAGLVPSVCTGTGCQGVPAAPPIFATPASVTFEGVGNFPASPVNPVSKSKSKPKMCKRGFVKKHGRCVKQKAKKSAKGRK